MHARKVSLGTSLRAMALLLRTARKYLAEIKRATSLRSYDLREELVLWDFRKEETMQHWDCICDRDVKGNSTAALEPNGRGTGAIFHGCLSTDLPADRSAKYSGYCAIRSKPMKSSLFDSGRFDLSEFDAFELRVRGDGRRFIANLQSPQLARKDDLWQSFLFTRGGPDWENIRLSFAEFFLTHRGYMQDHQMTFPRKGVSTFGLLLADRVNGSFVLEIQYIKAVKTLITRPESHLDE